jgi:endonuclease-3
MTQRQISTFFRRLAAADPAPQTELAYHNPYTLLVAVILSAQATDVGVNKATRCRRTSRASACIATRPRRSSR